MTYNVKRKCSTKEPTQITQTKISKSHHLHYICNSYLKIINIWTQISGWDLMEKKNTLKYCSKLLGKFSEPILCLYHLHLCTCVIKETQTNKSRRQLFSYQDTGFESNQRANASSYFLIVKDIGWSTDNYSDKLQYLNLSPWNNKTAHALATEITQLWLARENPLD